MRTGNYFICRYKLVKEHFKSKKKMFSYAKRMFLYVGVLDYHITNVKQLLKRLEKMYLVVGS